MKKFIKSFVPSHMTKMASILFLLGSAFMVTNSITSSKEVKSESFLNLLQPKTVEKTNVPSYSSFGEPETLVDRPYHMTPELP